MAVADLGAEGKGGGDGIGSTLSSHGSGNKGGASVKTIDNDLVNVTPEAERGRKDAITTTQDLQDRTCTTGLAQQETRDGAGKLRRTAATTDRGSELHPERVRASPET